MAVSIYKTSVVANYPYDQQQKCYNALKEISFEHDVEIDLGKKIKLSACGYEEEYEYPLYPNWLSITESVREWCKGFNERLDEYIDNLPEEDDDVTIPDLLQWANWMGIDEDELVTCAEDMRIGW